MLPTNTLLYLIPLSLITLVVSLLQIRKNEVDLKKKNTELDQKIYETLILSEISQKINNELNLKITLDIIVNYLNKLFPYTVVGYMVVSPDQTKTNLRFHLQESVNQSFLEEMKKQMVTSLNNALDQKLTYDKAEESVTGSGLDEKLKVKVSSLWVVPLISDGQGLGVLAIANKKSGFYRGAEMEVLNKILTHASNTVANLQQVLALEEEKLMSMVRSMTDGVLMLSPQMGVVVLNPAALRFLGLPDNRKITIFDIVEKLSDKIDLRTKIDESVLEDKLISFGNLTISNKVFQLLISAVKNSDGKILGSLVLFHDDSAQKELDRVRDEFTAMMVHELRAPLTVVRGTADMFSQQPTLATTPQGQDLMKTLLTSSTNMLSLVNDLLDAAKIDAGKFQILKTRGNLSDTINDRVTFFTQLANPKSIKISECDIGPDYEADFDRDRIVQVFNNLLSNAIKFTPVGGIVNVCAYKIETQAEIRWLFPENKPNVSNLKLPAYLVSVSDNGRGLTSEGLANLFSKFKQLQPSNGGNNGTGLGLVIARGIIESHGGEIFVQSRVNEGTAFYFTIPLS